MSYAFYQFYIFRLVLSSELQIHKLLTVPPLGLLICISNLGGSKLTGISTSLTPHLLFLREFPSLHMTPQSTPVVRAKNLEITLNTFLFSSERPVSNQVLQILLLNACPLSLSPLLPSCPCHC